jgi:NAD(P)-dependent dehydrogenase (short-subunit alcohol dehydrogenase family)
VHDRKEKRHVIGFRRRFRGGSGMSERVAIVAGAGGELGRVTAEKLAAAGFTVAGVDRSEEALKQLPDGIWPEAADPAGPAAARAVVDRIAAEAGPRRGCW